MSKKAHTGLGKGLGALLPPIEFTSDKGFKIMPAEEEEKDRNFDFIDIKKIHRNPYQPRQDFDPEALEDLKKSIQQHDVIQPITVRREINGYELISGERRLRAAMAAGKDKIPAYILDIDHGVDMLEIALIENLQREDLNPIEVAHGYKRLIEECRLTHDQVATKLGKDRTTITNFLRLLRLPDKIQESLRQKSLTMGHARAMLGLSNTKRMLAVWEEIIKTDLNVRATEKLIKDIESGQVIIPEDGGPLKVIKIKHDTKSEKRETDPQLQAVLDELEDKLRHVFGTQVKIHAKTNESGWIEFEFYSKDDFERLMELFEIVEKNAS